MKRILTILLLLGVLAGAAAGLTWRLTQRAEKISELTLYGNVDLRQVELAFNNNERIIEILREEGDRVHRGQPLARLDRSRLEPQVAQAEQQAAAQERAVERLHNGSRPEEKAQARANLASAKAEAANARLQYERLRKLATVRLPDGSEVKGASQEELDNARATLDVAQAKVAVNEKALELTLIGPRNEDIAEAEARLRANRAQLAFLKQQLADTELVSPAEAVVRTRLLEPGDMASPQRPVFSLALIDPKWVRAYVSDEELAKVHRGMRAKISVDSVRGRQFDGWIGFISSVAEFTPKTVQTEELRTALVYEVRVFVADPADELRLGMPATVHLPLAEVPAPGEPQP